MYTFNYIQLFIFKIHVYLDKIYFIFYWQINYYYENLLISIYWDFYIIYVHYENRLITLPLSIT